MLLSILFSTTLLTSLFIGGFALWIAVLTASKTLLPLLLRRFRPTIKDHLDKAEALIKRIEADEARKAEAAASLAKMEEAVREADKAAKITARRGATPAHYAAFVRVETRLQTRRTEQTVIAFRTRVKTIKLEKDDAIHAQALAVVDTFAELADQYAPMHDRIHVRGEFDTDAIEADLAVSVTRLDQALREVLEGGRHVNEERRFQEVNRYIEIRYQPERENPLSSLPTILPEMPIEIIRQVPAETLRYSYSGGGDGGSSC